MPNTGNEPGVNSHDDPGQEGSGSAFIVSVVMSTLNRAAYLSRSIDSVLAQDLNSLELIVVNDGSSDDTLQILERYRDDKRVRVIHHDENRGLPASLNEGIGIARGQYIARIDDDDHWTDASKLSRQVAFLEAHPAVGMVGTAYIDEWGRTASNPLTDEQIRSQMLFRCPFCHSSLLIRSDVFKSGLNYDENLPYAEDWELWFRVGKQWELANLDLVSLVKEQGSNTLSEQFFIRQLNMAIAFTRQYGRDYPGRFRATVFHSFNRIFFKIFPAGGKVHKAMSSGYRRVFGLK